jgi:hypothetical protein
MLINIIVGIAGTFGFLFLFWKKLQEDYASNLIFNSAFYIFSGIAAGLIISKLIFPTYWFWSVFAGICLGGWIAIVRLKIRPYELIEACVVSLLPWLALVYLENASATSSLSSFIGGTICSFLIAFYVILDRNYRNFTWYSSGKVGFSGLVILSVFFLLRALVAIFFPSVLSFVKAEIAISGILALIIFFAVFRLAKEKA